MEADEFHDYVEQGVERHYMEDHDLQYIDTDVGLKEFANAEGWGHGPFPEEIFVEGHSSSREIKYYEFILEKHILRLTDLPVLNDVTCSDQDERNFHLVLEKTGCCEKLQPPNTSALSLLIWAVATMKHEMFYYMTIDEYARDMRNEPPSKVDDVNLVLKVQRQLRSASKRLADENALIAQKDNYCAGKLKF
uniref:Uncharacterized protein n=1 Tax=Parascaris univalens TaxID=6257 RepID=A0A915A7T6_PARUN